MPKFYMVRSFATESTFHLKLVNHRLHGELLEYSEAKKLPNSPIEFELHGRKVADVVCYSFYYFINSRTRQIFMDEGFTGCSTYPVSVASTKPVDTYFGLSFPTEYVGFLIKQDSGNDIAGFDETEWNGSDFFSVRSNGIFVVTERVKEAVDKHNISGMHLCPYNPKGTVMDFKAIYDEFKRTQKKKKK